MIYQIKIQSISGEVYTVTLFGVESIAKCIQDTQAGCELKELVPDHVWQRPKGQEDLLIGSNLTHLMPKEIDNLHVRRQIFMHFMFF